MKVAEQDCIFCNIVKDSSTSYVINEDKAHIAFLDLFPLVEGQTVVTTKQHHSGYYFDMPDEEYQNLLLFAKKTAKVLDKGLGVERTMMVAQGYSIDHVHLKLFPVHEVKSTKVSQESYQKMMELIRKEWYSGFIVSMAGREKANEADLKRIQTRVRNTV